MRKRRTTSAPEREEAQRCRRARKASTAEGAAATRLVMGAFLGDGEEDGGRDELMGSPEGSEATGSAAFSVVVEDIAAVVGDGGGGGELATDGGPAVREYEVER